MPAQDLISRAARFFVLAEQSSRIGLEGEKLFWELFARLIDETASHLPAMAAAVIKVDPDDVWPDALGPVVSQSLPGVLPPGAVRWHERLVAAWEVHRASTWEFSQDRARWALVPLDGCCMPDGHERPSRLPEWLAEARKIASGERRVTGRPYQELEALAALAAWRPASRVVTPPETLREWVAFWLERHQSADPVEKGIAAIARLNLPEADLRAASVPPVPAGELLQQLSEAIQFAAGRKDPDYLSLLDWQPVKETTWPVADVENVARTWLKLARHKKRVHRCYAWRQLIRWDRAGSLDICGIDLLPALVKALQLEKNDDVLEEIIQWFPSAERFTAPGTPGSLPRLQRLERAWKRYRASWNSWKRASAWLVSLRLHQARLAEGPSESLLKDYLSAVAQEWDPLVLLSLAQCSPGTEVSGMWCRARNTAWQQRLLDENERIREIAAVALLCQSLEKEEVRSLRGTALELWRAGTKVSSEAMHTLCSVFSRFQEVRARLAVGEVPDFLPFWEKQVSPAERHRPLLALPPGRIMGREWQMENEELNMKNDEWRMQHQEATPNPRLVPDSVSR